MRRLTAVLIAVFLLGTVAGAQPAIYDDFNGAWLDTDKWKVGSHLCWGNCLEVTREIERSKLRLAVKSVARRDFVNGTAYAGAQLPFPDSISASLTSIQAVVLVKEYGGVPCPDEATREDMTHTEVFLGGAFFSTSGNGNWMDDTRAAIIVWIDTRDPVTMQVGLWWGSGDGLSGSWTPIVAHPIGTPLVLKLTWDQLGHRFIGSAKTLDPLDAGSEVSADYGTLPVAGPPVNLEKTLTAMTNAMNCSAVQSVSHVEARFDNVVIERQP